MRLRAASLLFCFSSCLTAEVDFGGEVLPILNTKCASCHGGVKKTSGFTFTNPETLFAPAHYSSSDDVALANALTAAADRYPSVAQTMKNWIAEFDQRFQIELKAAHPGAAPEDIAAAAFGIISIYFNIDALSPLKLPERYGAAAKTAALKLIEGLETSHHAKR